MYYTPIEIEIEMLCGEKFLNSRIRYGLMGFLIEFLVSDCSVGKYGSQVGKKGSQVGKFDGQVGKIALQVGIAIF
jgi:hypothetical protein